MPAGLNDAWCPSPPPSVTDEPLPQTVQPPLPTITADQVRGELRKTVNACLKLSKRGEPLQHGFNLSLQLGRVPVLWKTLFFHPSSQEGPPQCAEWLQASCLDVTYDDLGMATQGLHSPRQGKQCWEDYVLWFLQSLHHHPVPPTERQADRDEKGLTLGNLDVGLPHRETTVCQAYRDCSSETVVSSTGTPQGTVSCLPFTLLTLSEPCHM